MELVAKPLEDIVKSDRRRRARLFLADDDQVMVTARFKVGTDPDTALLRIHEKIRANFADLPKGIPEPLITAAASTTWPSVVLTLVAQARRRGALDRQGLYEIAAGAAHEVAKVDDVGLTYIVGGGPTRSASSPIPSGLRCTASRLGRSSTSCTPGQPRLPGGPCEQPTRPSRSSPARPCRACRISACRCYLREGRPVYVRDVANVVVGAAERSARLALRRDRPGRAGPRRPAVSLAIAKRKGANAVVVSQACWRALETVKGWLLPDSLGAVTRDYGATANDKANELLLHLALATVSIVVLIRLAIGWREGVVVPW